jgi:4-hydroxy-3-polyprenylbenzoate decarboxylase
MDGTIKVYKKGGFPRKWPNVVCSGKETITSIDSKWESLGIGDFVVSPSERYMRLCRPGSDEIIVN